VNDAVVSLGWGWGGGGVGQYMRMCSGWYLCTRVCLCGAADTHTCVVV
jgi:hypothetical protein